MCRTTRGAVPAWVEGQVWLRLEGFEDSVKYRSGTLKDRLARFGELSALNSEASQAAWQRIRDVMPFADSAGDVWRLSVRPSHAPDLVERMGLDVRVILDWGGGLIWALVPTGTDLRARIAPFAGHATRVRNDGAKPDTIQTFEQEAPGVAALTLGLRQKFDPRGLFSVGDPA